MLLRAGVYCRGDLSECHSLCLVCVSVADLLLVCGLHRAVLVMVMVTVMGCCELMSRAGVFSVGRQYDGWLARTYMHAGRIGWNKVELEDAARDGDVGLIVVQYWKYVIQH